MALRGNTKAQAESADRLRGALDHLEQHGHLLQLVPNRTERLAVMNALGRQGLVAWNTELAKYELTASGRQRLVAYRRAAETPLRAASA